MSPDQVDLEKISPKARQLLKIFAETSGVENLEKVIEDMSFSVYELLELIDTTRDPKIYPQDAIIVMNTVKAVLTKFTRFGSPSKVMKKEEKKI
jgi:hypothetical protein